LERQVADFKGLQEKLDKFKDVDPEKIREAADKLAEWEKLGEHKEVSELFGKYKELGTPDEIEEAMSKSMEALEAYKELGTPDEIVDALDKAGKLAVRLKDEKLSQKAEELAEKYKVDVETITGMLEKGMSEEEIEETVKGLRESTEAGETYKKEKKATGDKEGKDAPSRAGRILENLA